MVISCASVSILGYVFNAVLAYSASDMDAILDSPLGQPLAAILQLAMGNGAFTKFIWICTVISNFGVVFVNNTAGTRVYFAYARDGALPFSKWLGTVNKTTNTPINATLALSIVSSLIGLISLGSTNALNAFFSGSSLAGATAYLTPILMRCVHENNPTYTPGPFSLGRWSKPVRWVAVAWGCKYNLASPYISRGVSTDLLEVFTLPLFSFPSSPDINKNTFDWSVTFYLGLLSLILPWYYFRARKWYTGPAERAD